MIKINYLLPILVICLIFGCKKDDDGVVNYASIPSTAKVDAETTEYSVSVLSNAVTWTFEQQTSEDWVEIEDGDKIVSDTSMVIDLVLQPNVDTTDRVATFQVSYTVDSLIVRTFEITQKAQVKGIFFEQDTIFISSDPQIISTKVTSNVDWEAAFSKDWTSEVKTRVFTDKTLSIDVQKNNDINFRISNITLTQVGDTVSNNFYIFQNGLGTIESDSLVLVDLYNSTNGAKWLKTWDLSKPVASWEGVKLEKCENIDRVISLVLPENGLEGELPSSIGNLSYLATLSLFGNNLSGEIPESIGQLHNMNFLYLQNNQFKGEIPTSIGDLYYLSAIHLGNNELTGTIAPGFGYLPKLVVFGVENNNLTGNLPEKLGSSAVLDYLFVQGNRLSGAIPSTYTNNILWKKWSYQKNICPQQSGYGFSNCPE